MFKYATSELSQDAFLCWFMEWSRPDLFYINPELHQSAVELIKKMCAKQNVSIGNIKSITIERQVKGLDILVILNDCIALLIEDKTFTSEHSNQLNKYREQLRKRLEGKQQVCIYYKIGEQSNYSTIYASEFNLFSRKDMLMILRKGESNGVTHPLYIDYLNHLKELEQKYNSFEFLPVLEWSDYSWQGFYQAIQTDLGGKWGKVSNPRGGFWGFWWMNKAKNPYFLLLEQHILTVKLEITNGVDLKQERDRVMSNIFAYALTNGLELNRPSRLRSGRTITIAQRPNYIQTNEYGFLDLQATVKELKKYEYMY